MDEKDLRAYKNNSLGVKTWGTEWIPDGGERKINSPLIADRLWCA